MDVSSRIAKCLTIIGIACVVRKVLNKKRIKNRLTWMKPWIGRRESGRGTLNMLENELLNEDPNAYKNFLRMTNDQFNFVLNKIRKDIAKVDTVMRQAISPEKRLAVTLRFLATGETYRSLMYSTRIHESTIRLIVPEVCRAIYNNLKDEFLQVPMTRDAWLKIADDFHNIWNFPNCLGALDGKHINFKPPRSAGSYYYNYKGHHSIVLLAVADAHYKFLYIDVGMNGRISDGGIFRESALAQALANDELNIPHPKKLPGRNTRVPYVLVGDDAFALSNTLMKPFPQKGLSAEKRIYNYRLSRARRVIENSFGILANRFRIFLGTINLSPEKVEIVTLACCALHNYLLSGLSPVEIDQLLELSNRNLVSFSEQRTGGKTVSVAQSIRTEFLNYFNSDIGKVSWQDNLI